jgi:hypothetical protein
MLTCFFNDARTSSVLLGFVSSAGDMWASTVKEDSTFIFISSELIYIPSESVFFWRVATCKNSVESVVDHGGLIGRVFVDSFQVQLPTISF